ncbi:MAG: iron-only hydrogenase system regulator [Deltaproteobacteria bacterium]|jgi:putative iron-only hydrogenase system regulator|nr:iron-only hydrogenase system regulator [Deltaproteobacteria bacterium]
MTDKDNENLETRVAIVGVIVENTDSAEELNRVLHQYSQYIIGRMGIPYRQRDVHIISVAVDAPETIITALSGKLGKLPGVSVKTAYSGLITTSGLD